jgi:ribonucleoside-diphosphate reductase alpha chain
MIDLFSTGSVASKGEKSAPKDAAKKPAASKRIVSNGEIVPAAKGTPADDVFGHTAQLSDNARKVLEKRYLKKDDNNQPIEQPDDMFRRVAETIAAAETRFDPAADTGEMARQFYQTMIDLDFLPNSPTLMNAGRELGQLSACFVLPVEDAIESIFDAVKHTALIHKSGGGTGFNFSRLRPKNSTVRSTKGVSSGPISFMKVFDTATEVIKQGGTRRGANMGILRVDHPDILEFIECKKEEKSINNFNISIAITEDFMQKVELDEKYDLIDPHTKQSVSRLAAKQVFDKIVEHAWKNGEPGIVFIDRMNADNPTPQLGAIESTNPCGEQPLLPYESCNLGSINLANLVTNGKIDYAKLERLVWLGVRFLDNVIEVNKFPLPQIDERTKSNRKIGLGVMGYADMLIKMGVPYNSDAAIRMAEEVMGFIQEKSKAASVALGEERGLFKNFHQSIYDQPSGLRVRNATTTTIAPTGTISMIANCSSGVEPLFAISYIRNVLDKANLLEVHPLFEQVAKARGFHSAELMQQVAEKGTLHDIEGVPDDVKKVFVTAHDISPEWHIRTQAAFQKYTDNAVSKTVNFQNNATVKDVEKVYMLAYRMRCKGVTIYRDGSRDEQVLSIARKKDGSSPAAAPGGVIRHPRPRPSVTSGITEKVTTGCGNLYVTINRDEKGICEVFSQMGKAGACAHSHIEATSRMISLALRSGLDMESVIKQLKGIRCPEPRWKDGKMILSCADAIAQILEKHGDFKEQIVMSADIVGMCPDCGAALKRESGCSVCKRCGYSKCG